MDAMLILEIFEKIEKLVSYIIKIIIIYSSPLLLRGP